MTTTPKGFTQLDNSSAMDGPNQINTAELFVENLIDPSVPTVADLPASGGWTGRRMYVAAEKSSRVQDGSTWVAESPILDLGTLAPAPGTRIIEKVGYANVAFTSGGGTLTFPTPFPTACVHLMVTSQYPLGAAAQLGGNPGAALSKSANAIAVAGGTTATLGIFYTAFGY